MSGMLPHLPSQAVAYDITRPIVFDHLSSVLSQAQWFSILLVERAVVGLLKMCRLAADAVRLFIVLCCNLTSC